jgi:hypothetical protein
VWSSADVWEHEVKGYLFTFARPEFGIARYCARRGLLRSLSTAECGIPGRIVKIDDQ